MKFSRFVSQLFLIALVVCSSGVIRAQWSTDPTVNTTVSGAALDQVNPRLASDGAGGAIIVWGDSRTGTSDIYAQRLNAAGVAQWTTDGIAICTATNIQSNPAIVSDGSGGAIVVWQDRRFGSYLIYAQKINSSGAVQWTSNGVGITGSYSQLAPKLTTDGAGGAIITWTDSRSGVYVQRVNTSGSVLWSEDGVLLCAVVNTTDQAPAIVSDGVGGAIVTWQDGRPVTSYDVYAQRVNAAGVPQWTTNGVAICTASYSQSHPVITADGSGGALIAWEDYRSNSSTDIYAQRVDSTGSGLWTAGGLAICTATDEQTQPSVASDNSGGAYIAWRDYRSGFRNDIYAQYVTGAGAVQWSSNGIGMSSAGGDKYAPAVVRDGSGGAIIVWDDWRSITYGIYAQRYNAAGSPQWTANGVMMSTHREAPFVIESGAGGAIVTWNHVVTAPWSDVFAQIIESNSALPVELNSFDAFVERTDVSLRWSTATESNSAFFEIERRSVNTQSAATEWEKAGVVEGAGTSTSPKEYSLVDKRLAPGLYAYRLKQVDQSGSFTYSKAVEVRVSLAPSVLQLSENYPNPFNPSTHIEFTLPRDGRATLKVYDVLGRAVATLAEGEFQAGYVQRVNFDASNFPSGAYVARLEFSGNVLMKRMMLVK